MSERDERLVELDKRQAELDRARQNLDALLAWSTFLPLRLAIDLREMRTRLLSYLDQRDREIAEGRRIVEREIAKGEEG